MKPCINNEFSECTSKCVICKGSKEMSHVNYLKHYLSNTKNTLNKVDGIVPPLQLFIFFRSKVENYLKENNLPSNYITFKQFNSTDEDYTFDKVLKSVKNAFYLNGDKVKVLINNPQNNDKNEWREGVVTEYRHPTSERRCPFILVKVVRTYCKSEWNKETMESELTFYDKLHIEGFTSLSEISYR